MPSAPSSPECQWAASDISFLTAPWHFNLSLLPELQEQGKGIVSVCGNHKKWKLPRCSEGVSKEKSVAGGVC